MPATGQSPVVTGFPGGIHDSRFLLCRGSATLSTEGANESTARASESMTCLNPSMPRVIDSMTRAKQLIGAQSSGPVTRASDSVALFIESIAGVSELTSPPSLAVHPNRFSTQITQNKSPVVTPGGGGSAIPNWRAENTDPDCRAIFTAYPVPPPRSCTAAHDDGTSPLRRAARSRPGRSPAADPSCWSPLDCSRSG
jgi:hypothetical protein